MVTGIGAVTTLGSDAQSTWDGVLKGRSGVRLAESFDSSAFPSHIVGESMRILSVVILTRSFPGSIQRD